MIDVKASEYSSWRAIFMCNVRQRQLLASDARSRRTMISTYDTTLGSLSQHYVIRNQCLHVIVVSPPFWRNGMRSNVLKERNTARSLWSCAELFISKKLFMKYFKNTLFIGIKLADSTDVKLFCSNSKQIYTNKKTLSFFPNFSFIFKFFC